MNRLERFYKIDALLHERTVVPRDAFLHELEVSLATFKRDLEYMRDRFHAPVIWDADQRGYRFDARPRSTQQFELPGLWFTESEALALVTMQHLLSSLDQGGLIGPHIAPLMARLDAIIGGARPRPARCASASGCCPSGRGRCRSSTSRWWARRCSSGGG